MKKVFSTLVFSLTVLCAGTVFAGSFDAAGDYICDASTSEVWSYEGYRASDGAYLEMAFGRAPLTEVTKYGIEAHYIPDSEQPYYPFITRFPDGLWCSPATRGARYDAVITWTAPEQGKARFTGFAELTGNMAKEAKGKKIKVLLLKGDKELWSSVVAGGKKVDFDVQSDVSAGDKVHMHFVNQGDDSDNLTLFDLKVSTGS